MDSRLILLLLLAGASTLFWFLFIKPDKAPSATGVSSSRRGKRVRITFLHCWLFSKYILMPFRKCPEHDGPLLLIQAMQPLSTLLPVAHYKDSLEAKGLHPTMKQHSGHTDWTLTITWGAILYTSHRLQITHDQARYWLLCHFYAAVTKQEMTPLVIEEEEESEETPPVLIGEPERPVVREEEPQRVLLDTSEEPAFYRANTDKLFSLDAEEMEEEPVATLTELLGKDQAQFLSLLKNKLARIATVYEHEKKITQTLLKGILTLSEWRFLLNGEVGILWTLGIVERNELGETILGKDLDDAFSLVEQWSEQQIWGR